jgi:2-polyprenyl-6-methoxyphenol hydroxylase-like FAD-dependent oxidoreductase
MTTVTVSDLPLTDTDVLVVGAGPTGLMAGHVLGRRGIPAVVIDAKAGPTRESRALAVQARTMEIYDQLGLAERVLAGAYPATRIQIRQEINPQGFNIEAAQRGSTRYPGLQIFEQSRNEEMLSSRLAETGMGVHWQHRLVDLLDNTDGTERSDERIVALVEGPEGLSRIRARWCVGADGARSAVRRIQDVPFEGVTDDAMFCVADLRGVSGLPDGTIAARFGSATFALLFPLGPGGHARLISWSTAMTYTRSPLSKPPVPSSDSATPPSTGSRPTACTTALRRGSARGRSSSPGTPHTCTPRWERRA